MPRLFGTTSRCLSVQPVQLLPSRNIWRHISLIWPFPNRYRHSPWPVDVTELFPRFCCWALIWLSRQWAWLRRGYWRYRNLIDWLIDNSRFSALIVYLNDSHDYLIIKLVSLIDRLTRMCARTITGLTRACIHKRSNWANLQQNNTHSIICARTCNNSLVSNSWLFGDGRVLRLLLNKTASLDAVGQVTSLKPTRILSMDINWQIIFGGDKRCAFQLTRQGLSEPL